MVRRYGPARALHLALGVRLLAFVGLLALGLTHRGDAQRQRDSADGGAVATHEGQAMGLFNATTAVAGLLGTALGGWSAGGWGYAAPLGLAVLGVAGGVILASLSGRSGTGRKGLA